MKKQMSDTLTVGLLLAIVGGFLDAYTYICRGQVFANAQTGNIVLFGIKIMDEDFGQALYYAFPIVAFFLGIVLAEMIKYRFYSHPKIHWRQIVLLLECLVVLCVSFMPAYYNMLCNIMISFVCSLQVESFRKFNGNPYASTMCTGNLRSATEHLYNYFHDHDEEALSKSLQYFVVIAFFIIGACLGAILTRMILFAATIVPAVLLFIVICIMFFDNMKKNELK